MLFPTWRDRKNFYSWLHQVLASYCIKILSPAYLFPLVFQYKLQEETRWHHPPTCVEIFTRSPSSLGTFFIFHVTSGSGIATFCFYITRIPFLWYSVTFFLVLFNLSPAASSKLIQVLRKVPSRHFRFSLKLFISASTHCPVPKPLPHFSFCYNITSLLVLKSVSVIYCCLNNHSKT